MVTTEAPEARFPRRARLREFVVVLAVLLTGIVAAQLFLAGAGAGSSAPRERSYRPHHALGPVIFFLPLVTAALAMIARMPRRLVVLLVSVAAMTALQVLLTKVAQSLPPQGGDGAAPLLFGLHAVNGVVMLAVAGAVVHQATVEPTAATASDDVA